MTGNTTRIRFALLYATVLACSTFSGCGDNENARRDGGPMPEPSPVPGPASQPQYTATPVPFNLRESRTFSVLGWDSWPGAPTASVLQFRWNAAIGKYEVLAPGHVDWSRLEALQDFQFQETPYQYDVFGSDGTELPFHMVVSAPPHRWPTDGYVGHAHSFEGSVSSYYAFGIPTEPGDVPVRGTMTCSFGEDEIGSGELTFDLAAGTVSGWAEPFWSNFRYELAQAKFARGATDFSLTFGADGVMEGRFFGSRAVNVAVRAKGGGQGFSGVNGIMTGVCEG